MEKFIGYITDNDYEFNNVNQKYGIPSQYIVKQFHVSKKSCKYYLKVACLGVYSIYINNELVNDEYMSQDCTEYNKTITYRIYEISKFLLDGKNAIGFIVSDGWYSSSLFTMGRNVFGEYPNKIYYKVYTKNERICEADGTEFVKDGPIRSADNQNGIIIDNNFSLGSFSEPNYDLSSFCKVNIYPVKAKLKKSILPPVVEECRLKGKLIKKNANVLIYDFSQNLTGIVHLLVQGNKNDKIVIYHGETLTDDNDLYTDNLRTALAQDTFILNGIGEEEFLPRHTFHGFRFCKIVIFGKAKINKIEAIHFWSKLPLAGKLITNNKLANSLHSNMMWGMRDNFLSIPTDCPQRDERMGWTGDIQIFSGSSMCLYNTEKFLVNFVHNMMDSIYLYNDGVPVVSPNFLTRMDMDTAILGWSDAIIILPYNIYLYYGNLAILNETLPYMERYLKYLENKAFKNGLVECDGFGDWLSVFECCDKNLYNNTYYAYDCLLLSTICDICGKKDKSDFYKTKYNNIKSFFRKKYLLSNNSLTSDTQGAYVLSANSKVLELSEIKNNLIRKVKQYNHLTTGFHSTKYILNQLCDLGSKDLAYMLFNREEYPSWGYMISCGATTMWERWDSYKKDSGVNEDGMNSFNHYSLGSVIEWMYHYMVGIRPIISDPAFKTTLISPYFDKSVSKLSCSYKTKNGFIKVKYSINNDEIMYKIKADNRITLQFDFNNKIISKEVIGPNEFTFILKY